MKRSSGPQFDEEEQMYGAWEDQTLPGTRLETLDGRSVTIVSAGIRNRASGPDYLGAVLILGGIILTGPVEMHLREADWFLHGHQHDRGYDDVILHVLSSEQGFGARPTGIPTVTITRKGKSLPQPDAVPTDTSDLSSLLSDYSWSRFLRRVSELLRAGEDPLSTVALLPYIFDALGYSANRKPMGRTAKRLGVRGVPNDPRELLVSVIACACFPHRVSRRLAVRFGIEQRDLKVCRAAEDSAWDFSVRPENRPERRIIAGAVLIHRMNTEKLLTKIVELLCGEKAEPRSIARLISVRARGVSFLGMARSSDIVVNVLLPALAAHAIRFHNPHLLNRALICYRHHPRLSENRLTRQFARRFLGGRRLPGAFEQQGAIEMLKCTSVA